MRRKRCLKTCIQIPGTSSGRPAMEGGPGVSYDGRVDVTVRLYEPPDLAACRNLWRELTQRHRDIYHDPTIGGADPGTAFDDHLAREDLAHVWVAERGGQVIGLCGLLIERDVGEVEPVVVTAAERSRGVGSKLVEKALEEARARKLRFLNVRPVGRNVEAIRFFHRAGFRVLNRVELTVDLAHNIPRRRDGIELHGEQFQY
jgi:N-acetylglutamate synthase-like GNAT family acetyltransferase